MPLLTNIKAKNRLRNASLSLAEPSKTIALSRFLALALAPTAPPKVLAQIPAAIAQNPESIRHQRLQHCTFRYTFTRLVLILQKCDPLRGLR